MDDMDDPDNMNSYLDEAEASRTEVETATILPFKQRGDARAISQVDLPVIQLEAGELHNIATEAEAALIASETPFYVHSQRLKRPVVDVLPASHNRKTKVARLTEVNDASMIDRLSRSAIWLKYDGRTKKMVPSDPTPKVSATVLCRDGEWTFPRLAGVITTPTLRPDGTILSEAGYDPATQLLLLDPPVMPKLPPKPSKKAGEKALAKLDELLNEFPFVDDASRSVALSALITPVVRGALMVAPMHITKAPVAGSGKSYIIDLASAINSGEKAPVMSAGAKEEELEKRLVSALISGQTFISIDNVNGELGGDFLCQVVERPIVQPRILGKSEAPKIENRSTCFATGNNIRLVGDMTRRVVICSLDPGMERPETRSFAGDPFDAVLADRGLYVAAALTVVRSYVVAGCPEQLPALASFEDWSRLVRSSLVWLGRADPLLTMERAKEDDPITSGLRQVYRAWHDAVGEAPHTANEMIAKSNLRSPFNDIIHEGLHDAFSVIAGDRAGGMTPTRLGKYLKDHENRIISDLKLVNAGKDRKDITLWKILKP